MSKHGEQDILFLRKLIMGKYESNFLVLKLFLN